MIDRVLFVHNAYQHRGGEDTVVEAEIELLRSRGLDVDVYSRHNDEIRALSKAQVVVGTFWSGRANSEFAVRVNSFRPQVVHVHNTFPLISPSIYWVAEKLGVPVVQTLHNFRLLCAQAMFLKNGAVCESCLGRSMVSGVVNGCYRGSRAQSAVLVGALSMHRYLGSFERKVSKYIALNNFCRDKFIEGGLPADKIVVKPNFIDSVVVRDGERFGFLFVGRLSPEKGVSVLADAAIALRDIAPGFDEPISVVGDGADYEKIKNNSRICLKGFLGRNGVLDEMGRARALVLPSLWYENFPMTIVEAFASGLPVIASRMGAMTEIIENGVTGLLFEPGDSQDLARKIAWASRNADQMDRMGKEARRMYEQRFSADVNFKMLSDIYADVASKGC